MNNKILIAGCTGLLGSYLTRTLSTRYEVFGTVYQTKPEDSNFNQINVNLTELDQTKKIIQKINPDIVINAAGMASVDECESNPSLGRKLNLQIPFNITEALKDTSTKLIHISTDHLFDGNNSFASESDTTSPLNEYARTKLEAEQITLSHRNTVVIRTNFYGGKTNNKPSFSKWIYEQLTSGNKIPLFDDVFYTPISVCSLTENIEILLKSNISSEVFNIVGNERLSKYNFGLQLAQVYNLNPELIVKSSIKNIPLKAVRPLDMSLSIEKAKNLIPNFVSEDVQLGLTKIKQFDL